MKKSTNESPLPSTAKPTSPRGALIWEMLMMEGGISLFLIFPLVVLFFLTLTIE